MELRVTKKSLGELLCQYVLPCITVFLLVFHLRVMSAALAKYQVKSIIAYIVNIIKLLLCEYNLHIVYIHYCNSIVNGVNCVYCTKQTFVISYL